MHGICIIAGVPRFVKGVQVWPPKRETAKKMTGTADMPKVGGLKRRKQGVVVCLAVQRNNGRPRHRLQSVDLRAALKKARNARAYKLRKVHNA
jgi:hypothetical protein